VPELAGCSAHGNTEEEALANVKEAMELWIEAAVERSEPVPVPRERRLMYA
jgi:predicted RNase H-like HicB family nuclease